MQAIAVESFETGPVLLNLAVPSPGPGEVLVRVQSASVNGFGVAVAGDLGAGLAGARYPTVLTVKPSTGRQR
jgi:NADPH:quinone reductase-like Zn-dependent oxidoreductase